MSALRVRQPCAQYQWGLNYAPASPHIDMTQWQPPKREPKKTKAELYEMLAEAVRNTQPEPKRAPRAKRDAATSA